MRTLWSDVKQATRSRADRRSALLAATVLALGVAANNVAFSLVNAVFLRPLPVEAPERLVRIYASEAGGYQHFTLNFSDVERLSELDQVFAGVLAEAPLPLSVASPDAAERVWGELVTAGYFTQLGLEPVAGRFFAPEEDGRRGRAPAAVLAFSLWMRRFAGAHDVVGRTLVINGQAVTVVGVAPARFRGLNLGLAPDLWLPASMQEQVLLPGSGGRGYFAAARLAPGRSLGDARSALARLADQLRRERPATHRARGFTVLAESAGRVHPMARGSLMGFSAVLAAVAALLLVLACVNVAGLLLVRTAARRREIGVRLALGAGRARVMRRFLTEAAFLSLLSAVLGSALAALVTHLLSLVRLPVDAPLAFDFGPDLRVLAFSCLVAVAMIVLVGLAPAVDASRVDVLALLQDGGAGSGLRRSRLRDGLVVLQVALSTLLLVGGGLFLRGLERAARVDVGFDPAGVVTAAVDLGLQGYAPDEAERYWQRLLDRLRALPGVQSAALASAVPFELNITTLRAEPEGLEAPPDGWPAVDFLVVGPDYFKTLRIPLREGREYDVFDRTLGEGVVVVNDVFARRTWPDGSALGRRLRAAGARLEVIGVARAAKHLSLGEVAKPFLYFPHDRRDVRPMTVVVRGAGEPRALLRRVRDTLAALDPRLPVYNAEPLSQRVQVALAPARWGAGVLNAVGLAALLLAAVGLHGTLAHTVERRTHEIGVRRVLGAQSGDVARLVARHTLGLVGLGLALGLSAGFALARLLVSLLHGVSAADPLAFVAAPLVLLAAAWIAAWAPLRQALRVAPAEALRHT